VDNVTWIMSRVELLEFWVSVRSVYSTTVPYHNYKQTACVDVQRLQTEQQGDTHFVARVITIGIRNEIETECH